MLEQFKAEELQFLEAEIREFKVMDNTYLEAQLARSKSGKALETYDKYWFMKGFEKNQIKVFREALAEGVEITRIAQIGHTGLALRGLLRIIKNGVRVKSWLDATSKQISLAAKISGINKELANKLNDTFDEKQLETINKYAELRENCNILLNPELTVQQMNALMQGVKAGVFDPEKVADAKPVEEIKNEIIVKKINKVKQELGDIPDDILKIIAEGDMAGVDMRPYISAGYRADQMEVLLKGRLEGIDTSPIENPELEAADMAFLCKDLTLGRDVSYYNQPNITLSLRRSIRDALLAGNWSDEKFIAMFPEISRDSREFIAKDFRKKDQERRARDKQLKREKAAVKEESAEAKVENKPITETIKKMSSFDTAPLPPEPEPVKNVLASAHISPTSEVIPAKSSDTIEDLINRIDLLELAREGEIYLNEYMDKSDHDQDRKEFWLDELLKYLNRDGQQLKKIENPTCLRLQYVSRVAQQGPKYPETEEGLRKYIQEEIEFLINLGLPYKRIRAIAGLIGRRLNYYPLVGWISSKTFDEIYISIIKDAINN